MPDAALLGRALHTAVSMRDKVVVLRVDAEACSRPAQTDAIAATLALLRSLELRPLVVLAGATSGTNSGEVQQAGQRLLLAILRHGQKALELSATGIVTVKKLMVAAPAAGSGGDAAPTWSATPSLVPFYIPMVDPLLLTQLCSLRYIPILLWPALQEADEPVDYPADDVAAAVAKFLEAAELVFLREAGALSPPTLLESWPRPLLMVRAKAPERLLTALFPLR